MGMRQLCRTSIIPLLLVHLAKAEIFLDAISNIADLSDFHALLQAKPDLAPLLTNPNTTAENLTVLASSNAAFDNYHSRFGTYITDLPFDQLQALLQYQILTGIHTLSELQQTPVIPSQLTGAEYNNRSAGAALQSNLQSSGSVDGQVVIIQKNGIDPSRNLARQDTAGGLQVKSALYNWVNMTVVDGTWDHGVFQIINGFLTLPENMTSTITACNLTSLSTALDKTGLSTPIDQMANITCIGPSDQAFLTVGNPQLTASITDLSSAVEYHNVPQVLYTNFLQDGQEYMSLNNDTIKITKNSTGTYFNDARVIKEDVLTNNGVMQVVDKVMSLSTNSTATATSTSSSTAQSTSTAAAPALLQTKQAVGFISLVDAVLLLILSLF